MSKVKFKAVRVLTFDTVTVDTLTYVHNPMYVWASKQIYTIETISYLLFTRKHKRRENTVKWQPCREHQS